MELDYTGQIIVSERRDDGPGEQFDAEGTPILEYGYRDPVAGVGWMLYYFEDDGHGVDTFFIPGERTESSRDRALEQARKWLADRQRYGTIKTHTVISHPPSEAGSDGS